MSFTISTFRTPRGHPCPTASTGSGEEYVKRSFQVAAATWVATHIRFLSCSPIEAIASPQLSVRGGDLASSICLIGSLALFMKFWRKPCSAGLPYFPTTVRAGRGRPPHVALECALICAFLVPCIFLSRLQESHSCPANYPRISASPTIATATSTATILIPVSARLGLG